MDWFAPRLSLSNRTEPLVENLSLTLALLPPMLCVVIGEEVLFRGLLMNDLANQFDSTTKAGMAAIVISSTIFGLGHFRKGHHGMMSSTIGALVFAGGLLLFRNKPMATRSCPLRWQLRGAYIVLRWYGISFQHNTFLTRILLKSR